MKLIGRPGAPTHSFVTFRCDEDRDLAIDKLNNYLWKSNELSVKKANPIPDPLIEKRNASKRETNTDEKSHSKRFKLENIKELSDIDLGNAINDQIVSLWKMPYSQQIDLKKEIIEKFLVKLFREIGKILNNSDEEWPHLNQWYSNVRKTCGNKCCPLEDVKVSPIVNGYRNKCEFSVGIDKSVGFRLGLYKEGSMKGLNI